MSSIEKLMPCEFPTALKEIADPPTELYRIGNLPQPKNTVICVVGARKHTEYGRRVCERLISGLRSMPITIVSGLALGIDSVAHRSALKAGLQTIAVPGSGLDRSVLYPASHVSLAREIVSHGGGLLSEFEPDFKATPWSFPKRNRIMAGLSNGVLVIEAVPQSGTLITARLATEYNRDVLAVPGSVFSPQSSGPHSLIRDGAVPVTCTQDIIEHFSLTPPQETKTQTVPLNAKEQQIFDELTEPLSRELLVERSHLTAQETNATLSLLEIKGVISEINGQFHRNSF